MLEKFREPDKAASYVSSGLMHDFPDATAEVIHVLRGKPRRTVCEVKDIAPVLLKMCKGFPMASVEYHPSNPYGFVAEIRCHGETGKITTFRRHKEGRPRILVLLTKVAGQEVMIGSHRLPTES